MTELTGLTLRAALKLIAEAVFYIRHSGTSQHKIGWFHAVPGIIHGNRASLGPPVSTWTAAQVHGALPPALLDPALMRDLDYTQPIKAERNRDYEITDIDAALTAVHGAIAKPRPDLVT